MHFLEEKLKVLYPERDDTSTFIVPELNVRSEYLIIKDRRNDVGNQFSNSLHLEKDSCLILLLLICSVPGIPHEVLQQVIAQASHLAQNHTANV